MRSMSCDMSVDAPHCDDVTLWQDTETFVYTRLHGSRESAEHPLVVSFQAPSGDYDIQLPAIMTDLELGMLIGPVRFIRKINKSHF